jgi:hypothetical protein
MLKQGQHDKAMDGVRHYDNSYDKNASRRILKQVQDDKDKHTCIGDG